MENSSSDFNQKLIRIVRGYPIIFDRSHPLFYDEEAIDKAWDDIGWRLGMDGKRNFLYFSR